MIERASEKLMQDLKDRFYETVISHREIYSLLYSPNRIKSMTLKEQIECIPTSKLKWSFPSTQFIYVYGWPGPDFNVYTAETYGKGWAFTKQEIIKAWGEND